MCSQQTMPAAAAITLPARVDLTAVRDLGGDFLDHDGQNLRVDASAVQHLGGLGLQLLMAAAGQWRQRQLGFQVNPRSDNFDRALADFGVSLDMLENRGPA
ncbi:STAS domain-containing protein [Paracoccus jiaweipingae]|uniref:STAS domain-containing protein n=1 Tax=unclassified Paracoccus (in: a-proteobacteria) TaxID=2688777 RepID=UPI0037B9A653